MLTLLQTTHTSSEDIAVAVWTFNHQDTGTWEPCHHIPAKDCVCDKRSVKWRHYQTKTETSATGVRAKRFIKEPFLTPARMKSEHCNQCTGQDRSILTTIKWISINISKCLLPKLLRIFLQTVMIFHTQCIWIQFSTQLVNHTSHHNDLCSTSNVLLYDQTFVLKLW
ncbi:hypothetical protein Y1Q_0006137 [Alligator mississippiensis]|uniref:Uncharacterized protein n=1 Tax=Alligator mississippiensis TaxID=8496 RepID=A0A151NWJ9_ALLMI|nr:hypothetical protein Y1Q_0006137 [Alligator mississippiensis]